jgi:hypothetical protein
MHQSPVFTSLCTSYCVWTFVSSMVLGGLSWGCVSSRLDLALSYLFHFSLGGPSSVTLVVLIVSCGGEENQCVRGVCVRFCSIWGWSVTMGVMLKKYMGAILTCISGLVYVSRLLWFALWFPCVSWGVCRYCWYYHYFAIWSLIIFSHLFALCVFFTREI